MDKKCHNSTLSLSNPQLIDLLQAVLEKGKCFRFEAKGASMSPFIKNQDVITIAPLPPATIANGDVIAFRCPDTDKLIVHRAVKRTASRSIITKGDNLDRADGTIPYENLLGIVTAIERAGRQHRLGLGPEKYLLAWLSRNALLKKIIAGYLRLRGRRPKPKQKPSHPDSKTL